jgi:hypothetical protein
LKSINNDYYKNIIEKKKQQNYFNQPDVTRDAEPEASHADQSNTSLFNNSVE